MQQFVLINLGSVIDNVTLEQGSSTNFNTNINGTSGTTIKNLERDGGATVNCGSGVNCNGILDKTVTDNAKAIGKWNGDKSNPLFLGMVDSDL